MSEENLEMVRRGFDAYERGDLDAAVTDFASDCEFVPTGALPGGRGVYQGLRATSGTSAGSRTSSRMRTLMSMT
jgi:ketosteroid isomerase-like protein